MGPKKVGGAVNRGYYVLLAMPKGSAHALLGLTVGTEMLVSKMLQSAVLCSVMLVLLLH